MKFVLRILCAAIGLTGPAASAVEPDPALARASLADFLHTTDDQAIAEKVAQAHLDLKAGAKRAPQEHRLASVLLVRGLTSANAQELLAPWGLTFAGFEARLALHATGTTKVIAVDHVPLAGHVDADIRQKIEAVLDRERMNAGAVADKLYFERGTEKQQADLREIATSRQWAVYRLDVAGSRDALLGLLRAKDVRAVFVDEDPARLARVAAEYRAIEHSVRFDPVTCGPGICYYTMELQIIDRILGTVNTYQVNKRIAGLRSDLMAFANAKPGARVRAAVLFNGPVKGDRVASIAADNDLELVGIDVYGAGAKWGDIVGEAVGRDALRAAGDSPASRVDGTIPKVRKRHPGFEGDSSFGVYRAIFEGRIEDFVGASADRSVKAVMDIAVVRQATS